MLKTIEKERARLGQMIAQYGDLRHPLVSRQNAKLDRLIVRFMKKNGHLGNKEEEIALPSRQEASLT